MVGICEKCKKRKILTKHHVYPSRYFKKQNKPLVIYLCRECHNLIEEIIPYGRLEEEKYYEIACEFVGCDLINDR